MKTTLLIPIRNELIGLKDILPKIDPNWVDQILFIDGNSNDGSVEYINSFGYQVLHQKRKGIRRAYLEAMPNVIGDAVITFSPDGNSLPETIPELIEKMIEGDYDIVIASRYLGEARSEDDNILTALANKYITGLMNFLFGGNCTDALGMYRIFKKEVLVKLGLLNDEDPSYTWGERLVGDEGISWEWLFYIRALKKKLKITEIPSSEPARLDGEVRVHWRWGFACMIQLWREFFFWEY